MTVTIELSSEIAAYLKAQAQAQGLDLPQYVELVLREQVPALASTALSPAQRADAWRKSAFGLPRTPPLSDDAISRESIYGDRGR